MKRIVLGILIGLLIGIGCSVGFAMYCGYRLKVKRTCTVVGEVNPLISSMENWHRLEFDKQQEMKKFEGIVAQKKNDDKAFKEVCFHAMCSAAVNAWTNHIQMLLQAGVDIKEPIQVLESDHETEAARLIRSLAEQHRQ